MYEVRYNGLISHKRFEKFEDAKGHATFLLWVNDNLENAEVWYTSPAGICSWADTITR